MYILDCLGFFGSIKSEMQSWERKKEKDQLNQFMILIGISQKMHLL